MSGRRQSERPAKPAPEAGQPPTQVRLRIAGPVGGRWRAGRRWGAEAVEIDAADLGPAAVAALRADPALVVAEVQADRPPSGG